MKGRLPAGRTRGLVLAYLCWTCVLPAAPAGTSDSVARQLFARWRTARERLLTDASVVAYYDFQEREGTVLGNKSGAGTALDGAILGAQWADGRWPGKGALRFDGKASLVEVPASEALGALGAAEPGTGELTIELWMNATTSQEAGIVDRSSAGWGKDAPYMIWISPNLLCAYVGKQPKDAVSFVRDRSEVPTGVWTHVALVIDSQSLALYKHGVLVGSAPRGPEVSDNGRPLLLGAMGKPPLATFYFHGLLDEVVIYGKALPAAVIRERAALVPAPEGPPSLKLISPRGGERWSVGSRHRVAWKAENLLPGATVKIESMTGEGTEWQEVEAAAPDTGTFIWRVPEPVSTGCRVRVSVNGSDLVAQNPAPFTITPSQEVRGYEWVKIALPAAFAPRDGAGALVHEGRMWLIGGWNPGDRAHFPRICNNEVWSSQDGTDWTLVKPNSFLDSSFDPEADWEGRHTAGYVVHRGKMWIVGGDANQGHYMHDVWSSTDGKTWTHVNRGKPVPWGPRVLHYCLAFGDRIWVMGGQTIPQFGKGVEEVFYRDIWTSTDGVTWQQVQPKEPFWPQRGMIGGSVVFKDRMWVLGGGTYDTPKIRQRRFFNDVWSSADGVNWECHLQSAPWEPRQYHEVAVFDDRMWVLEGSSGRNRKDVWHSADGVNWHEVPDTPWTPRHAASVFVHDDALWMVAGNNMQSDVWKLVRTAVPGE